jgi:hypothetical protein
MWSVSRYSHSMWIDALPGVKELNTVRPEKKSEVLPLETTCTVPLCNYWLSYCAALLDTPFTAVFHVVVDTGQGPWPMAQGPFPLIRFSKVSFRHCRKSRSYYLKLGERVFAFLRDATENTSAFPNRLCTVQVQ